MMLWHHAGDGGKRARSPGRSRISRKTIAQGMPADSGVPVVANACAFFAAHAAAGASRSRHSLRPLISSRASSSITRADRVAGIRSRALASPSPRSYGRGVGGLWPPFLLEERRCKASAMVRGCLREPCTWGEPLTRNSQPRISTSPRKGRGEVTSNASR
jgi:hypothetical protein